MRREKRHHKKKTKKKNSVKLILSFLLYVWLLVCPFCAFIFRFCHFTCRVRTINHCTWTFRTPNVNCGVKAPMKPANELKCNAWCQLIAPPRALEFLPFFFLHRILSFCLIIRCNKTNYDNNLKLNRPFESHLIVNAREICESVEFYNVVPRMPPNSECKPLIVDDVCLQ